MKKAHIILVTGVLAAILGAGTGQAHAADYCIAVNGGFGKGGQTFVGKGFTQPLNNACKPWSGIVRTGNTVVGTSSGSACMSKDGKLFTLTVSSTNPEFFGFGVAAVDHIQLCPQGGGLACPAHGGQSDQGYFSGPAAKVPCTQAVTTIPSSHD